jgi:hypothetical protein
MRTWLSTVSRARVGALIGVFLAVLLVAVVVGTRTTSTFVKPKKVGDGARCALVEDRGGPAVRCARVLAARPNEVLSLVRDHAHFGEIFEGDGWGVKVEKVKDEADGRVHLVAGLRSWLGTWPIDVRIESHDENERAVDSWDERGGPLPVNRGSWSVEPAQSGSLLTYQLEVEVPYLPGFLVHDALLVGLRSPLHRVGRRLDERRRSP